MSSADKKKVIKKVRKKNNDEKEYKPGNDDYDEEDLILNSTDSTIESVATRATRRRNQSPNDPAKSISITPSSSGEHLSQTHNQTRTTEPKTVSVPQSSETVVERKIQEVQANHPSRRSKIIMFIVCVFIFISLGLFLQRFEFQTNSFQSSWIEDESIKNIVSAAQKDDTTTEQKVENIIEVTSFLLKSRMGRHKCYMEESYLESTENMKEKLRQLNLTNFDQLWTLVLSRIYEGKTNIKHFKHYLYTDVGIIPFSCSLREKASKLKLVLFLSLAGIPVTLFSLKRSKQRKYDNDILERVCEDILKIIESQNALFLKKEAAEPFVVASQAIGLLQPYMSSKRNEFWQKVMEEVEKRPQVKTIDRTINGNKTKTWEKKTI